LSFVNREAGIKKTTIQIVLLCNLIFLLASTVPAGDAGFGGKIAFLRSGEIWIVDQDGGNIRRVTNAGGKVEDFLFSPSIKYVAYSKRIKTVEEPGLWEKGEKPPQKSVCSIAIQDLRDQKTIYEMVPPEGEWIEQRQRGQASTFNKGKRIENNQSGKLPAPFLSNGGEGTFFSLGAAVHFSYKLKGTPTSPPIALKSSYTLK
jgi:hypothetical protein